MKETANLKHCWKLPDAIEKMSRSVIITKCDYYYCLSLKVIITIDYY